MDQLFTAIWPDLQVFLGLILTGLASFAANELRKRTGIDVKIKELDKETQLRDVVVMALTTGVKAMWMKYGATVPLEEQARLAVAHAERSVPDALKGLTTSLDRDVLANRAMAIQFDNGLGQGETQ